MHFRKKLIVMNMTVTNMTVTDVQMRQALDRYYGKKITQRVILTILSGTLCILAIEVFASSFVISRVVQVIIIVLVVAILLPFYQKIKRYSRELKLMLDSCKTMEGSADYSKFLWNSKFALIDGQEGYHFRKIMHTVKGFQKEKTGAIELE